MGPDGKKWDAAGKNLSHLVPCAAGQEVHRVIPVQRNPRLDIQSQRPLRRMRLPWPGPLQECVPLA